MTRLMKCTCEHAWQDATYGNKIRVHNESNDGKKAYCTVCCPSNRVNKNTITRPARKPKSI